MVTVETSPSRHGLEPIAIIGSGCRLPGGSNSPPALWKLLKEPRDVLNEIPPSRFDVRGFHHEDPQFPGHANVKHSYLLEENIAHFDASFFSITPAEAVAMDPQQRLLLETVYEAMEASGLTIEGLKGSDTGVYVGLMYGDYEALQYRDLQSIPTYHGLGSARSIVSNRVSYFFDWHGPSLTVDTACSSSLVAVHQAVQALRSGDIRVAVAAGTNLLLGPEPYIYESKLKMLSPEGRSRMWDKDANGYARGEGVAAIMLKTISAALADGDYIECIIRETGVNQDGRSRGITMPRASAQAALINATYRRAGLDPASESDRCQYFEAHGTGTPAGDPVEAEAIHTAFFGHDTGAEYSGSKLLVGSIKTIIGHTESTAGLAGILKVSQALQHGYIPPNLLLNHLNPNVQPFYEHLQIPQKLTPWPQLLQGQRRRASVNSFGFGGTNAHIILESFQGEIAANRPVKPQESPVTPFLFSAQSKHSLLANLNAYVSFLEQHPNTDPQDLAWSLQARRSRLPLRVHFPPSPIDELQLSLKKLVGDFQLDPRSASTGDGPRDIRILGVFTGQGAQWARMGAELIETSALASRILSDLDKSLQQLPRSDRPSWTLRQELLADALSSNVGSAVISQPLCTAVQVILVELLKTAGIQFSAVVGHSSGEIAAAFAAGYLSSWDAIRVAYYRGFHAHLAASPNGSVGAMLAVGTSLNDAQELCNDEEFICRINVAACNSPVSVTLSGDEDAVVDITDIFEDEGKFVRRLRVDKAYHSHHMQTCSQPYLSSIKDISTTAPGPDSPAWFSSVYPNRKPHEMALIDPSYWIDNLLSPVLFMQAVESAISSSRLFDAAVEVGPHSALKGPVRDILQHLQVQIPYTGTLERKVDSIRSISGALGYLWSHVDHISVDFDSYAESFGGRNRPRFLAGLPIYKWNHGQEYWNESNLSRNLRQRSHAVHTLLGDLSPHSSSHQLAWKHMLRPKDIPWVHGHRIQGQTVFPAAGYVATALETAPFLANGQPVQLVEVVDLVIHQALVFDNDDQESGIEVRSTVSSINRDDLKCITASFTYESCTKNASSFHMVASGRLLIYLGEPSREVLEAVRCNDHNLIDVPAERFYSSLKDTGYEYAHSFKALTNLRRKLGNVSGSVATTTLESNGKILTVHPAVLDAAFHSILLAFSYPGDGQLWSLHLPTQIRRIRVNPTLCGAALVTDSQVPFEASIPLGTKQQDMSGFEGDVEIHSHTGGYCAIQVEGLHVVPFTPATAADDEQRFYAMRWIDAEPDAAVSGSCQPTAEEKELADILERGSLFYLRQLESQIPLDCPGRSDKYHAAYLNFAAHTLRECQQGKHRYAKPEWLKDNKEHILDMTKRFSDRPEVKAMHTVGEHMHRTIRGETTMLEHLIVNGILDDYYARALSMAQMTPVLADSVLQVVRRYPSRKILEVGSGTGGATRQILRRIGNDFATYTFTDVSAGFFENAQSEFASCQEKMIYSTLDLEADMQTQGFEKDAYDIVVASLVIHATKNLEQTLRRIRYLLKPGGYLIACEVTNADVIRVNSLFGCLPGWWQGIEEGRTLSAAVSDSKWDSLLRNSGFSGIDSISSVQDSMVFPTSVFVSQAVDDWVEFIREPLLASPALIVGKSVIKKLFIVGGATFQVSRLVKTVQKLIRPFCDDIVHVQSLEGLGQAGFGVNSTLLVLEDLDHPVFKDMTAGRFESLKSIFGSENTIVWVTQNRRTNNPFASMPVGFARSALWEVPELRCQFIDFEDSPKIDARVLVESLLRFEVTSSAPEQVQRNVLWSVESEIIITSDGRQQVQRMGPIQDANDRYNSARRAVTKRVNPAKCAVSLSNTDAGYIVNIMSTPRSSIKANDTVPLHINYSTLRAVRTIAGDAFLWTGKCRRTGAQYIAVTDSVASLMDVQKDRLHPISVPSGSEAHLLRELAAKLVMDTVSKSLRKAKSGVINDAPLELAKLLQGFAVATGTN